VPGFGDAVTVEVRPDDGEVLASLHCLVPGGGFAPAGRPGARAAAGRVRGPVYPGSATPRSTSMAGTGPPADHPAPDSGRYELIYSGSCTDPRHRP